MRRKGAFRDNLIATERLLTSGIAPRWQLFITKRCINDLDDFTRLIYDLDLHKRCEAISSKFEVFIGGMSPEGNGYELENERIDENDLSLIPHAMIDICHEGVNLLGQPEYVLLDSLMNNDAPPDMSANSPCVSVNADFDVYPNIAEPTEWWRLGNLKTDGVDAVIKAYRDETTPGMRANREMPVKDLAKKYGDINSKTLYHKDDLVCKWMHQLGIDYMRSENEKRIK